MWADITELSTRSLRVACTAESLKNLQQRRIDGRLVVMLTDVVPEQFLGFHVLPVDKAWTCRPEWHLRRRAVCRA